jgi:hypothetical protein
MYLIAERLQDKFVLQQLFISEYFYTGTVLSRINILLNRLT